MAKNYQISERDQIAIYFITFSRTMMP